ncbi:unnamed protein product [Prorocentrum cordatum]|uniref:Uncharacterized protein n=1 Tax=Prorocentrum cordatum TaxID=2364126 RepID=A0ABN9TBW3_9DINO|nr:unnamed protein product [Polarella glacialis]
MEFKDFATGVVAEAARAALDATPPDAARAAHNAGLLADMLSAAAGAVEAAEWLWVWSRGAVPLCCHRGLEAHCRERLGRAALAFMRAWGEGADGQAVRDLLATVRADAGHAPFEWRSLLALQIDLLCLSPPAAFPAEHVAALLQQVFDAEDEDWISEQLSKVHEARRELPLPPGGQAEVARIWKSLGRRGGGSAGAGVSAMRLSAIYGAHNISEEFLEGGLTHRTRATRRLAIELLRQLHGGAAWWPAWHSAFLVLSDEQPWHIVRPVWEDVTALGGLFKGAVPARWTSALVRRAAAHSDHRVVRHATADAIRHSAALDPAVVLPSSRRRSG